MSVVHVWSCFALSHFGYFSRRAYLVMVMLKKGTQKITQTWKIGDDSKTYLVLIYEFWSLFWIIVLILCSIFCSICPFCSSVSQSVLFVPLTSVLVCLFVCLFFGLDGMVANLRWAIWTGWYWMKTSCTIGRRWWCNFNRSLNATGRRSFSLRRRGCWCLVCYIIYIQHITHT